jgi:signal transduction histidine kinase
MSSVTNVPINAEADPLRVLLLAPTGRDAALACRVLNERGGFECLACRDPQDLCAELSARGAGAIVLTDEALSSDSLPQLLVLLTAQPAWSDLPVVVMLETSRPDPQTRELVNHLRAKSNVTLLERPVQIVTLISAVEAALRGRRRQYEVRALLREQEQAVRHRDQFLAMLGHELRNPLATITHSLALLQDNPSIRNEAEGEEARQIIRRQIRHLARLVDDLLDVARITSGKIVLRRERLDLRELAADAVRANHPAAAAQGHRMTLAPSDEHPVMVDADPVRIEQVLSNLLSNAIKYTSPGGHIAVSVMRSEQGACAVLSVRDNGMGISAELLPRVFDLFAQAEPTLDRARGGMGIGLTLVRGLVELHGGSIAARSDGPGTGSEFTVRLPLASPLTVAPSKPVGEPRRLAPAASHNGDGQEKRRADVDGTSHVLIVEDNIDARRAMQRLLQSWGHAVDVAEDGPGAIALAASRRPRVAVVDIGLPGLDGYDVARQIRAALGSSVQLIAMTGYGQPEDKARARDAGFDIHLVKPVDPAVLRRAITSEAK